MKAARVHVPVILVVTLLCAGPRVSAFHSGGTGECTGCHSMHDANATSGRLLKQSDASSVCLSCHQDSNASGPSAHLVSTPESKMPSGVAPLQRTPGGDFGWLKKHYTYTASTGQPASSGTRSVASAGGTQENGASHGHNIVAADFGYVADPTNTIAPGGSFSAASLSCTSCHDPHGSYRRTADGSVVQNGAAISGSGSYRSSDTPSGASAVGVYRLLAGEGYSRGGVTYTGAPVALAPDDYNRAESSTQTRVAYGHGTGKGRESWSRWCATCHPQSLSTGHSSDVALSATHRSNYAAYVKSGDMTGSFDRSYQSLVPFVENVDDYGALAAHARSDNSSMGGAQDTDMVTCLTCHRAHASGFEYMMRWNNKATFLTFNGAYPGTDTTPGEPDYARGRTSAETRAAYYDRPVSAFATYQRTLCNKCHARD